MARTPDTATREFFTPSEQSLLENYGVTSAEFNRVREPDRELEPGQDGSQMVKDDKPALVSKPPKEMAQDTDREAFDRKWAEELQRTQEQDNILEPEREYSR